MGDPYKDLRYRPIAQRQQESREQDYDDYDREEVYPHKFAAHAQKRLDEYYKKSPKHPPRTLREAYSDLPPPSARTVDDDYNWEVRNQAPRSRKESHRNSSHASRTLEEAYYPRSPPNARRTLQEAYQDPPHQYPKSPPRSRKFPKETYQHHQRYPSSHGSMPEIPEDDYQTFSSHPSRTLKEAYHERYGSRPNTETYSQKSTPIGSRASRYEPSKPSSQQIPKRPLQAVNGSGLPAEKKAPLSPEEVYRQKFSEFRSCFLTYVTHKFRATIGKSRLIRDGELVLVAFSGGPASSALIHLIQQGLSEKAHKKLRFKPGLMYIDEGAVTSTPPEERLAMCEKMLNIMQDTGYPSYIRSIEQGLDLAALIEESENNAAENDSGTTKDQDSPSPDDVSLPELDGSVQEGNPPVRSGSASVSLPDMGSVSPGERTFGSTSKSNRGMSQGNGYQSKFDLYDEAEARLAELLKSLKSVTAKENFLRTLRNRLFVDVARQCGYTKVMTGHCGTRLSVNLLSDIAQGRGGQASMDTAFADERYEDITFVRPLRDFTSKEITMYNVVHNVTSESIPTLTTKEPDGASIDHLTEAFVTGLQADYPSTVSNIMRTGEKLESGQRTKLGEYCSLCQAPLDTNVGASSALKAVEFSRQISRQSVPTTAGSHGSRRSVRSGASTATSKALGDTGLSRDEIISTLCYGCRVTVQDMDDLDHLPNDVVQDIAWRVRRFRMLADIQDNFIETGPGDS